MGLNEASNKVFLRVSNGKICKTVDQSTPGAQARETKKGDTIYELVWESLTGILDQINFRDHQEYGKSWILDIMDDDKTFALQIHEDSRYGIDILKKIPRLYHGKKYTIKPYEFEQNGKRKAGISILEESSGEKIGSFYQEFTDKGDGTWDVKDLHDFPKFEGDKKDKDDLKIYFVQLAKFLRGKALEHINKYFRQAPVPQPDVVEPEVPDPLPF